MVPLDVAKVIKVARAYAHTDASRGVLERAASKIAAADSTRPSAAARELADRAAPKVEHSVGEPEAALSASPTLGSGRTGESDARLDALASKAGVSEMEKEAFLRAAKGLMSRWGAGAGAKGRVGRFLSRDVRSPVQVAKAGPGAVSARVRSPVGPAPKAQAPSPKPVVPAGAEATGAYRSGGRKLTPAEEAQVFKPMTKSTKQVKEMARRQKTPGLFRTMAGPLVLPGLAIGGLMAGKKFVDFASRAANRPAPYSFGRDQFAWGYGPQGQAPF